jgi:hypothetical protein
MNGFPLHTLFDELKRISALTGVLRQLRGAPTSIQIFRPEMPSTVMLISSNFSNFLDFPCFLEFYSLIQCQKRALVPAQSRISIEVQ